MNLKSGLPYSLIKYGLVEDYPRLSKNIRADVVVIGAGISGALAAWHLADKGIDTVVIDGRTVGLGSTCASSSLLLYEIDMPLYKLKDMIGTSKANAAYLLSLESVHKIKSLSKKIGFKEIRKKECVYYAASKNHIVGLKKEYAARKKIGIDLEFISGDAVHSFTGLKADAALVSSQAADTDAYLFTHAILRDAEKKGVRIFDRTRANSITADQTGVRVEIKQGFHILAKKIVFATGYESVNYIDKPIVKLKSTYATISESFPASQTFWPKERLAWNTADPYLYFRTTPDHRILVGGRDENFYSPAKRNKLISSKTKELAKDFHALYPELNFIPEFSWTGTFGYTKDGLPYIGSYPKMPNSYFALGFGGNGITFSLLAAEIITDLVLGKKTKHASVFSFDR